MPQKERHTAYVDARRWELAIKGGLGCFSQRVNTMLTPYVERGKIREMEKKRLAEEPRAFNIDGE